MCQLRRDTQRDSVSITSVTIQGSAGTESECHTQDELLPAPYLSRLPLAACCPPAAPNRLAFAFKSPVSISFCLLLQSIVSFVFFLHQSVRCYSKGWSSSTSTLLCPECPFIHVKRSSLIHYREYQRSTDARESRAPRPRSDILYKDNLLVE